MFTRLKEYSNLDFQRFEFLGDAVIEVYTLLLAKRVLNHLEIPHKPEDLHNFKALLLSSFGLAMFGISLKIVENYEPENFIVLEELKTFAKKLGLFESKRFWQNISFYSL